MTYTMVKSASSPAVWVGGVKYGVGGVCERGLVGGCVKGGVGGWRNWAVSCGVGGGCRWAVCDLLCMQLLQVMILLLVYYTMCTAFMFWIWNTNSTTAEEKVQYGWIWRSCTDFKSNESVRWMVHWLISNKACDKWQAFWRIICSMISQRTFILETAQWFMLLAKGR